MMFLDWTAPTAELNLACDDLLLDEAELRGGPEVLRVWEATDPFVVLGYGNSLQADVNEAACIAAGIPILRRSSGGGTVLQAFGCFNYALVLRVAGRPEVETVPHANRFVMERHREMIQSRTGLEVEVRGITDLALGMRKFSGNAQRRKRETLLFHGVFLLGLDLELLTRVLQIPARQPTYRGGRSHADFLTTLPMPAPLLKQALAETWQADEALCPPSDELLLAMVQEKQGNPAWVRRV